MAGISEIAHGQLPNAQFVSSLVKSSMFVHSREAKRSHCALDKFMTRDEGNITQKADRKTLFPLFAYLHLLTPTRHSAKNTVTGSFFVNTLSTVTLTLSSLFLPMNLKVTNNESPNSGQISSIS